MPEPQPEVLNPRVHQHSWRPNGTCRVGTCGQVLASDRRPDSSRRVIYLPDLSRQSQEDCLECEPEGGHQEPDVVEAWEELKIAGREMLRALRRR